MLLGLVITQLNNKNQKPDKRSAKKVQNKFFDRSMEV